MRLLNTTAICTALLLSAEVFAAASVGQPAPDFNGTLSDGATVSLSALRGKTVVLEWTNHDCPYVRKHYGAGNMQAQQKAAKDDGVVWLSIISSAPGKQGHVDAATANQLTRSRGAEPTGVVLDPEGEIGNSYGARTTPHMYIVDASGVLRFMGGIDSIPSSNSDDIARATQYVPIALAQLAAGEEVNPAVTRPYGCSVKYR